MAVNVRQIRENRCPDCAGLGSNNDHEHCDQCHGTGFVAPTTDVDCRRERRRERWYEAVAQCVEARCAIHDAMAALHRAASVAGCVDALRNDIDALEAVQANVDGRALNLMRAARRNR